MERRISLKKDANDFKKFRYSRDRHLGVCVSNEFYQNVPFFFTRDRSPLWLTGQYRGRSIFMMCNGPSIASGKYDLSLLKKPGIMTYGMNNGAKTLRPNFWSCVDDPQRFIKSVWLDSCITKFVPHAHAEKPLFDNEKWEELTVDGKRVVVGDCPNVIYFHRNEKFMADRFLFEDTFNWGNSGDEGGGRSVMLPVLRICFMLGFRKIYLMGADFNMSEDYTYHFDEQRNNGAVKGNLKTYDRLQHEYFPQLKPYLDAEGVEVYNCNPDSKLTVFPFIDFNEAIREASSELGDVENERTWGLYVKSEDKMKFKTEPDKNQKPYLKNIDTGDKKVGKPISREEALNMSKEIMQKAESRRTMEVEIYAEEENDDVPVIETKSPQVVKLNKSDIIKNSSPNALDNETPSNLQCKVIDPRDEFNQYCNAGGDYFDEKNRADELLIKPPVIRLNLSDMKKIKDDLQGISQGSSIKYEKVTQIDNIPNISAIPNVNNIAKCIDNMIIKTTVVENGKHISNIPCNSIRKLKNV